MAKARKKAKKATVFEFSENNSGGRWWLGAKEYKALFKAGWTYEADEWDKKGGHDKNGWTKDDPVPYGWRKGLKGSFASAKEAVESWEQATGRDFFAEGCNCCGSPFRISGGEEYVSGDSVERTAVRPF